MSGSDDVQGKAGECGLDDVQGKVGKCGFDDVCLTMCKVKQVRQVSAGLMTWV